MLARVWGRVQGVGSGNAKASERGDCLGMYIVTCMDVYKVWGLGRP